MLVLFWSAKGGSGVTVVAAATALVSGRNGPTVLVDLGGDTHAALGVPAPIGPGALDWMDAPNATPDGLFRLGVDVADGLRVVGAGSSHEPVTADSWERLAAACTSRPDTVIVDAGRHVPPEVMHGAAAQSILVVRPCFLGLRRAARHSSFATAAVLVTEPGRALTAADVERALGVTVEAEVPWDPAVARAVDAGLLSSRLPNGLVRQLRRIARSAAT